MVCSPPGYIEFSRQEYWSGLPFPSSDDLPDSGIEPTSPVAPALAGGFFTTELPGKPLCSLQIIDYGDCLRAKLWPGLDDKTA